MSKNQRPTEAPTGAQLEILEILSQAKDGMTAAEVWAKLNQTREAARTTVITLLQRLELRGWLDRDGEGRGAVYRCAHAPEEATAKIADGFLDRYFEGSASKLVLNLLGEGKLSREEIGRLRAVLDRAEKVRREEEV